MLEMPRKGLFMYDDDIYKAREEGKGLNTVAIKQTQQETYRVVLDGVKSEIETPEAFAIKFSLLTRVPVTKIKHMMQNIPAVVWKGQNRKRSSRLLSLIEEAGGRGRIVLEEVAEDQQDAAEPENADSKDLTQCRTCGFPLKEEDKFCTFCMSPVERPKNESADKEKAAKDGKETDAKQTAPKRTAIFEPSQKQSSIPPWRLFIYCLIVLIALVVGMVSSL
jgi:hypothetical protein